jgi:hypothetical protein
MIIRTRSSFDISSLKMIVSGRLVLSIVSMSSSFMIDMIKYNPICDSIGQIKGVPIMMETNGVDLIFRLHLMVSKAKIGYTETNKVTLIVTMQQKLDRIFFPRY